MFGIPLEGLAEAFCINQGLVKYLSIPESVLSRNPMPIVYHAAHEAVAAGILHVFKEDIETKLADVFTKI